MDNRRKWLRRLLPLVLVAAAGVLLFTRLDVPDRIFFDETYYVNDARDYLDQASESSFAVHPPVGKWLIATGIALAGDNPVGWRIMGAAAAALSVLLVYLTGLRLFDRLGTAALAALLVAVDGLFFVQARTGMLDIYLALFVVLGAYLLVVDRDRSGLAQQAPDAVPAHAVHRAAVPAGTTQPVDAGQVAVEGDDATTVIPRDDETSAPDADGAEPEAEHEVGAATADETEAVVEPTSAPGPLPRVRHPYRLLAGVAFGLAVSTKWSGLLALGAAGLLAILWELAWRRRVTGSVRTRLPAALASIGIALVLIPVGVYVTSYVPWIANYTQTTEGKKVCGEGEDRVEPCEVSVPDRFAGLWRYQQAIADFHFGLEATHPYRAPAYTWPIMARPVVYYWETCSEDRANQVPKTEDDGTVTVPDPCVVEQGDAAEILAVGNPALWYGFLAAVVLLMAGTVRGDQRALFITTFWGAQFLPWLIVSRPAFFFYMVPAVPFLALGVAYATRAIAERRLSARLALAAVAGAGIGFATAYAGEQVFDTTTSTARWIGLGVGWAAGAMLGARWDARMSRVTGRRRAVPASAGRWVAVAVAVAAVGLFLYFFPVWTGIPMPEDAVHNRWWLRGWV